MSKFFTWKDSYSVGIKKIDDQHKRLLDITNELYTVFTVEITFEKLYEILNHLIDYSQYHFSTEEIFFAASGYPFSKEHRDEHHLFQMKIKGFIVELREGDYTVTYKLMRYLRHWLINHFEGEDQKFGQFIKQKSRKLRRIIN